MVQAVKAHQGREEAAGREFLGAQGLRLWAMGFRVLGLGV